ncbi:hypothetical protein TNCV_495281 [Trichonephila clavipes]|nr:hypothetical protein TNCV_495281 [Trichonephila clavipes]
MDTSPVAPLRKRGRPRNVTSTSTQNTYVQSPSIASTVISSRTIHPSTKATTITANSSDSVSSPERRVQVTAPLPALRVEQSAPFSVARIDFGNPLYTKDENQHHIVFTCAVTRALHLELVNNLITETFLLALR